jgi:ribose transport system substrate-binding protein
MKKAGDVAAQDYGVDSTWQSADGSLEKQISTVENYIQQKVNAILIDPIDAKGIVPVIAKAKEAGIPVITMGNKVEGNGNFNTLYPDYENMGMVARAIGKALDGKGEVALLTGSAGNFVSDTREKGFKDVMGKEFPNIKVVGVQPTNFDPAQAQRVAETWLNNFPNLNAIAFISDPLGLAAISAAEAKGKKLIYGGVDGDAEMHPFLENGTMVIDVLTGASRVGYWNVAAAARIAKGTKFPTDLFMPTHFVMSATTADMLKGKGLDIKYIEPKAAIKIADGYSEELGPKQSDERISGKQ